MGKHTSIFGVSKVAGSWAEAYAKCTIGDDFSKVVEIAGEPDEKLEMGNQILYRYVSEEWKGILRGGTVTRKMEFIVRKGKIVSKTSDNLDRISW